MMLMNAMHDFEFWNKTARSFWSLWIFKNLKFLGCYIKSLEASLEEKGKIERDDAMEKASLEYALEEEQDSRASLEEKLENIEDKILRKATYNCIK